MWPQSATEPAERGALSAYIRCFMPRPSCDLLELNCRPFDPPVAQLHFNRPITSRQAAEGASVPVDNKGRRTETESSAPLCAGSGGIDQNACGRGRRRHRATRRLARLRGLERAQVADRVSVGINKLPFDGKSIA